LTFSHFTEIFLLFRHVKASYDNEDDDVYIGSVM